MPPGTARSPRFHLPGPLAAGVELALPPDAGHHASRVLRMREGDAVTLFNGEGGECTAELTRVSRDNTHAQVISRQAVERESPHFRRKDRANSSVKSSFGGWDAAQPAIEFDDGPIGELADRAGRTRCDPPAEVCIDDNILTVAREHLASARIKELQPPIESAHCFNWPGQFEVQSTIRMGRFGLIVDRRDHPETLDDHQFRLIDKHDRADGNCDD